MTDEQEALWWDTVDDGCRLLVHLLMVALTWPLWLIGRRAKALSTPSNEGGDRG